MGVRPSSLAHLLVFLLMFKHPAHGSCNCTGPRRIVQKQPSALVIHQFWDAEPSRGYYRASKIARFNDYQRRNIASRRMHYRPDSPEDLLQLLMLVGNLFSQEPRIAYARFYGNVGRQIADDDQASISVTLSHFMKRRQYGSSPLGHEIGRDEGKFLAASVGVSCRHFDLAKDPHRAGATCVQRVMTHRALRRPITCEEHAVRVL